MVDVSNLSAYPVPFPQAQGESRNDGAGSMSTPDAGDIRLSP